MPLIIHPTLDNTCTLHQLLNVESISKHASSNLSVIMQQRSIHGNGKKAPSKTRMVVNMRDDDEEDGFVSEDDDALQFQDSDEEIESEDDDDVDDEFGEEVTGQSRNDDESEIESAEDLGSNKQSASEGDYSEDDDEEEEEDEQSEGDDSEDDHSMNGQAFASNTINPFQILAANNDYEVKRKRAQAIAHQQTFIDELLQLRVQSNNIIQKVAELPSLDDSIAGSMKRRRSEPKVDVNVHENTMQSVWHALGTLINLQIELQPSMKVSHGESEGDAVDSSEEKDAEWLQQDWTAENNESLLEQLSNHAIKSQRILSTYGAHTLKLWQNKLALSHPNTTFSTMTPIDTVCKQVREEREALWDSKIANVDEDNDDNGKESKRLKFDDSELYGALVRELLTTSSYTGGASSISQSAKANILRQAHLSKQNSLSAQVDRRASKGRKIRYVPIPKLVNFMAPCRCRELRKLAA